MSRRLSLQEEFPNALIVERLQLTFTVRFAMHEGVCQTLEGPVAYQPGTALITGYKGEQWPVEAPTFLTTYAPVNNDIMGKDGLYERLPQRLMACKLNAPMDVVLGDNRGVLHGRTSDWLVEHPSGSRAIVAADIFPTYYRIIGSKEA